MSAERKLEILLEFTAAGNLPQFLTGMLSQMGILHTNVETMKAALADLGSAAALALGSGAAIGLGVGILDASGKLVEAAKDLNHAQALFAAAGFNDNQQAEATAKAWQMAMNVRGAGVAESQEAINHLTAIFGDVREATRISSDYVKTSIALGAITGRLAAVV